ncbi:hypothetical protein Tco_0898756 [Tanacetum coccineum]
MSSSPHSTITSSAFDMENAFSTMNIYTSASSGSTSFNSSEDSRDGRMIYNRLLNKFREASKGSKIKEKLVHLRMVVKFEVLIEKKKMCSLSLMRFDWWMVFLMVHLEELEIKKLL